MKKFSLDFYGRDITVEVGKMAKQANGSALIRYGDTAILSAAVMSKEENQRDFFPLMVLYQEKLYSVGKIPGGFIKREGRPSDNATLTARLIDRPIRPMFPEEFNREVQVVNTVFSVDQDNSPEMTAMFGSSLALGISDIPFNGPVASVIVGRVDGKLIINPTPKELEESDIELTVAGTKKAVNMVEAAAKEVSEKDMHEAILFGHKAIKKLVKFQEDIIKKVGKNKLKLEKKKENKKLIVQIEKLALKKLQKIITIKEKLKQEEKLAALKEEIINHFEKEYEDTEELEDILKEVRNILEEMEKKEARILITRDKIRPDGRKITEIRKLDSEVDIFERTHGSALFTRGETQALSITTLGAQGEHQILDGLGVEEQKRFMHHYNFPNFSVGETGRYGSPGRREIGHGNLGERALAQVLPSKEDFPYTIRVVSEVLESNGSSSQASICAGCMSLMAAGVPIKAPVAGIAMGLIMEGKDYTILTDIQGFEDHHGDMDFKVAGTKKGICALQMDIKIEGITSEIMEEALDDAKKARMKILDNMSEAIKEPRKELSKYAPKMGMLMIKPEKIKEVIGKGGETIDKIIEEAGGVKIDISDSGEVVVYHMDQEKIDIAIALIENIVKEVEPGKIYTGKITRIEAFGCFVELWKGCEGMVHISQLAEERVEKIEDMFKLGDEIVVKAKGYDKKGRLDLSRKDALK